MLPIRTARLILREFTLQDTDVVLGVLTDPDFIRYVADRGIRSQEQAIAYLHDGPLASYARYGHGLWCVARQEDGVALGMCGLIRRDNMPHVDLGYALLPHARGSGYAREAAEACLVYGREELQLSPIVAYIHPDNRASAAVLEAVGMRFQGMVVFPGVSGDTALYE
ncbi:GNAT family N-acetyltransferase [Vogesella sp. LIG4]|uniref:GNAT family N-acetyltransferase n=1 Tax=Vogesella sp. LIG4 TaxID=1192162 RepID=UPI00081FF199|nr:GNAT family N-acetyltransferase [Vogesella sp. LIG4]SCK21424.1 Protein N-acetyltransferase, RimJ/RimL family [Vogesella sp. LIG4]